MGSNEGNHAKVVPVEITDTIYIALSKLIPRDEMQIGIRGYRAW